MAPPPGPTSLAGTSWIRVDDEQANPHGATIAFEAARASGHTGCNRWFAAMTQADGSLRFGEIGTTRMACQTEMQADTERNFLSALRAARFADRDADTLVLLDENRRQIATFQRMS